MQVKQKTFLLNQSIDNVKDVAILSLKLSLKAYFATYKGIRYDLTKYINVHNQDEDVKNFDWPYPTGYIENAYEAVNHFHHFIELFIKDILKQKDKRLALDYKEDKFEITDLILKGGTISDEKIISKCHTVSFVDSIKRLERMKKGNCKVFFPYNFLISEKPKSFLLKLNYMRNAILHKGIEVYHYQDLDELFCKELFPIMKEAIQLKNFNNHYLWKFNKIQSDIDLVDGIIKCGRTIKYQDKVQKLAILKEMGRAAYENSLHYTTNKKLFERYNEQVISTAYTITSGLEIKNNVESIIKCPVCGLDSLVQFTDVHEETSDDSSILNHEKYVSQIHCFNCTFHLPCELSSVKKMEFPFHTLWQIDKNDIDLNKKETKERMRKLFEKI